MSTSVVIPAYQHGRFIDEALASVIDQASEIIVVDDGSTDDTADRVSKWPVRYVRQPNQGTPGGTRNVGLRLCTQPYIAFLDADDISHPQRLRLQAQFLDEHPEVGLVVTNFVNFSAEGEDRSHWQTCPTLSLRHEPSFSMDGAAASLLLLRENFALPSSMMIRREVLTRVPGFTTEVTIGEDVHFAYLVSKRWDVGFLNLVGAKRRVHGSNISGDMLRMLTHWLIAQRMLRASETRPVHQRELDKLSAETLVALARVHADRRQFRESWRHGLEALPEQAAFKMLLRTVAMAGGLKRV